jgi:hypothetical protein
VPSPAARDIEQGEWICEVLRSERDGHSRIWIPIACAGPKELDAQIDSLFTDILNTERRLALLERQLALVGQLRTLAHQFAGNWWVTVESAVQHLERSNFGSKASRKLPLIIMAKLCTQLSLQI